MFVFLIPVLIRNRWSRFVIHHLEEDCIPRGNPSGELQT